MTYVMLLSMVMKENVTKKLFGVTTAMVTLFNEHGDPDLAAIRRHTSFLIDRGVHCLYPLGTTGEMFRLSESERKSIASAVVDETAGRVPVFVQVGAMRQIETIALARHAVSIGADGIGVVSPAYYCASEREIENYYHAVAEEIPSRFPMYLYNIPQLAVNDLSGELVERIAAGHENIIGIKYSYPDFLRTSEYLDIRDGTFSVMHGTDSLLTAALALGCDGTISGISSVYPEPFVRVYEAVRAGEWGTARKWQRIARRICGILRNGGNMAYFKEGLSCRGIVNRTGMRAPALPLNDKEAADLRMELAEIEPLLNDR